MRGAAEVHLDAQLERRLGRPDRRNRRSGREGRHRITDLCVRRRRWRWRQRRVRRRHWGGRRRRRRGRGSRRQRRRWRRWRRTSGEPGGEFGGLRWRQVRRRQRRRWHLGRGRRASRSGGAHAGERIAQRDRARLAAEQHIGGGDFDARTLDGGRLVGRIEFVSVLVVILVVVVVIVARARAASDAPTALFALARRRRERFKVVAVFTQMLTSGAALDRDWGVAAKRARLVLALDPLPLLGRGRRRRSGLAPWVVPTAHAQRLPRGR